MTETFPSTAPTRPRIWAVSISKLRELFRDIAPDYEMRADVRIVSQGFEEAVAAINAAGDDVDVIVAAGSNGAYLRSRVNKPVVLVNVTGFDVMQALANARRLADSVALMTYGQTLAELEQFRAAFDIKILHAAYSNAQDAEGYVAQCKQEGVGAIIGPGLIVELAEREGLNGIFLYSLATVRSAFDMALEIAQAARIEARKRDRLDAVLKHLRDGVVALDAGGRVQAMNERMANIMKVSRTEALGQPVNDLVPGVLPPTWQEDEAETVHFISGTKFVVLRTPILEKEGQNGMVITFQEAQTLQRIDRSLRSRHRPHPFIAKYLISDLLGDSAQMQRLRTLAERYARVDATVMVFGESGSGKELLAQGIHNASKRRDYPFVAVNCGALPEGLLESELFGYEEGAFTGARRGGKPGLIEAAHGGTLFLDEIGEMPFALQVRLLRVLQEREVVRVGATQPTQIDIRVIAATHRSLEEQLAAGNFRVDLFYRLNILRLNVPPLRTRSGDVALLSTILFSRALERMGAARQGMPGLQAGAMRLLAAHAWPGNVRELENVIERIAVHVSMEDEAGQIDEATLRELAPELAPISVWPATEAPTLKNLSLSSERQLVEDALEACGGDRDAACARLGISRSTLWRRLRQGE
jgi:propionate catabolism operon transcriptional regulator